MFQITQIHDSFTVNEDAKFNRTFFILTTRTKTKLNFLFWSKSLRAYTIYIDVTSSFHLQLDNSE